MPRSRVPTRISDPDARLVAGRMVFAAAAEALGGVYGTVAMERALAFSPGERARRHQRERAIDSTPIKRSLPTGTCKKWLKSHVPLDQTLALIADPNVAGRMKKARDSDVVKALWVAKDNYRFVGSRIAALSPDLFGDYLGCMALGHCNPGLVSGLKAGLLNLARERPGSEVLVAVLGADRQMPFARPSEAEVSLDDAFELALRHAAQAEPEVAFSQAAIAEAWAHRSVVRERAQQQQTATQELVAKIRKLRKFMTN